MKPVKVLSLFDGISCGRIALERANIPVERYVAYEIEKTAIKIAQKNYPDTEEMGDVFKADFHDYKGFDMLIGGSPCTFWSIAQKAESRETTNSGLGWDLFSQYVRALKEGEIPYFLYENNYSMDKNIKAEITKAFNEVMQWRKENLPKNSEAYKAACNYDKIEPVHINSGLVSAQSRDRYYWTNIPCNGNDYLPSDKGISFKTFLNTDMPTVQRVFAFREDMPGIMEDQIIYAEDTLEKVLVLLLSRTRRQGMTYTQNGKPTHISGKMVNLKKTHQNS